MQLSQKGHLKKGREARAPGAYGTERISGASGIFSHQQIEAQALLGTFLHQVCCIVRDLL
jgi:hypothetical protein